MSTLLGEVHPRIMKNHTNMHINTFIAQKSSGLIESEFGTEPTLPIANPIDLPRNIYMFWDEGFDAAPDIVKYCFESWKTKNSSWNIKFLTLDDAKKILSDMHLPENMIMPHYADALRTELLMQHGGVWVDATVLCSEGLDSWLPNIFNQTNFFAFSRPAPDRIISNWFLASTRQNALITEWHNLYFRYITSSYASAPYFFHHYIFEYLIKSSNQHAAKWQATPKMSAEPPHFLQNILMQDTTINEEIIERLKYIPMHKLTYKSTENININRLTKILEMI